MEENAAHQENEQHSIATIWASLSLAQQEVEATMSFWGGARCEWKEGAFFIAFARVFSKGWGWGSLTWVVCTVPRLQVSARRFRRN